MGFLRGLASKALGLLPGNLEQKVRSLLPARVVDQDGLKWFVTYDTRYGYAVSRDRYEHHLHDYFFHHAPPEGVFLDVGAGAGKYSLLMAKRNVTVFAWEPNPLNRVVFKKNLELNGLTDKVTLHEEALGSSESAKKMSFKALASRIGDEGGLVSMKRLDSYEFARVDLIKIDVEGYEYEVLKGAAETIKTHKPALIVELHPKMTANTRVRCTSLLEELGYSGKEIGRTRNGNSEYLLFETNSRG